MRAGFRTAAECARQAASRPTHASQATPNATLRTGLVTCVTADSEVVAAASVGSHNGGSGLCTFLFGRQRRLRAARRRGRSRCRRRGRRRSRLDLRDRGADFLGPHGEFWVTAASSCDSVLACAAGGGDGGRSAGGCGLSVSQRRRGERGWGAHSCLMRVTSFFTPSAGWLSIAAATMSTSSGMGGDDPGRLLSR